MMSLKHLLAAYLKNLYLLLCQPSLLLLEYNSSNLQSNFYQNVVVNYEDKEITCDYLDVDMQTNIAIAYNNVVVRDPQSIMRAGKIILNIETKVININPDNKKDKVTVTIN